MLSHDQVNDQWRRVNGLREGAMRLKIAKRSSYFIGYFISLRSGNNWRYCKRAGLSWDSESGEDFFPSWILRRTKPNLIHTTAVTIRHLTQWSEAFPVSDSSILTHWKHMDVENIFLGFTWKPEEDYWFNKLYLKKSTLDHRWIDREHWGSWYMILTFYMTFSANQPSIKNTCIIQWVLCHFHSSVESSQRQEGIKCIYHSL